MKLLLNKMSCAWYLFLLVACNTSKFDPQVEEEKILTLHHLQRQYHFEKMAEKFVAQFSLDQISINRGEVKQPTREESLNRFKNYFDVVEFEKWDDKKPPIIRFSDDGSLAYAIVSKEVIVNYLDEKNKRIKELTEFAWVAIYRKYKDEWKMECIASTNKPGIVL